MYNYPNSYAPTYNFCPCCGRPVTQGQYVVIPPANYQGGSGSGVPAHVYTLQ